MTWDQAIGFLLALLIMMIGLVGAVLPGLPGTPLVFLAALGHRLWFGDKGTSTWVLVTLAVLMLASIGLDFLATTLGAKKLGSTWRGMVGAVLGAMIGLFFVPLGLILGPVIGAILFEMLGGREWRQAGKAGVGAAIGVLAGAVGKAACCVGMIGLFAINVLLRTIQGGP